MNMSDRADVYNGLLDGMMWAEGPVSVNGAPPDPEDLSFKDFFDKQGAANIPIDPSLELRLSNVAYAFVEACVQEGLDPVEYNSAYLVGVDLWLTTHGHGTGFWAGDYGEIGDRLTEIADRMHFDFYGASIETEDGDPVVLMD